MNFYEATSAFDQHMLSSIPKKVKYWIKLYGMDDKMRYDLLRWDFVDNEICLFDEDTFVPSFVMQWTGAVDNPTSIRANKPWVENISKNLVSFVKLEKRIYDNLERLDEEVRLARQHLHGK